MQITFTSSNNNTFTLTKFGSAAYVTYAAIGVLTLAAVAQHYSEKAFVAYKRRVNRKINAK